jgi:nucleoside-diphosphate-sugar epimerase
MGYYGIAKAKAEEYLQQSQGIEWIIIRPKSFIGTGRLGIFQILFDWIEQGRKIPVFGSGDNRFQLLWVEDLVEAIYRAALYAPASNIYNIGAKEFNTVNIDVGALLEAAGTGSRLLHVPSKPLKFILRVLEMVHLSPVYRWVYDTADQDSFVSIQKAEKDFQYSPQFSNQKSLIETYQWYLKDGKKMSESIGTGHRVAWKQGILGIVKHLF